MPAVVIAAALGAAAVRAIGRWGIVLELAALAAVGDGIDRGPPVPGASAAKVALLVAAAAVAALIAARWARARRPRLSTTGALAVTALAVLVVAGRLEQRRVDRHTYARFDPVFAWIDAHAPAGHRIGLTGATGATPGLPPVLPAFGPRLGNRVTYVGDRVVHSVELPARKSSFQTELRRGHYDLLVIGLPYAGATDLWARELGFRELARSDRIALYAIPPGAR
jgi:hypothetical protein